MKNLSQITKKEITTGEQKLKTLVLEKIERLTSKKFAHDIKGAQIDVTIRGFDFIGVEIGYARPSESYPATFPI